jgi:hypothetical protein
MLTALKRYWREFKRVQPGKRFQERYERNLKTRAGRSPWVRFLKPIAAILLLAAGIFLCLVPGPGLPLLIIGAGLLADVSRRVAVAMDWLDLRIRALLRPVWKWWKQASLPAKAIVAIVAVAFLSGLAYGVFRFFK